MATGSFLDGQDAGFAVVFFKLYPVGEGPVARDYADHSAPDSGCLFLETRMEGAACPNKGLLPGCWEMFEDHPNCLPAFFRTRCR